MNRKGQLERFSIDFQKYALIRLLANDYETRLLKSQLQPYGASAPTKRVDNGDGDGKPALYRAPMPKIGQVRVGIVRVGPLWPLNYGQKPLLLNSLSPCSALVRARRQLLDGNGGLNQDL